MVLTFRGTAHPPEGLSDPDIGNLSNAEIHQTNISRKGGIPMLFEHDTSNRVGTCVASWVGEGGELRVMGMVDDPETEHQIRSGKARELSLGTNVVYETGTNQVISKKQDELSVVIEGRRPGCAIDVVDNERVSKRRNFSKSALAPLSTATVELFILAQ